MAPDLKLFRIDAAQPTPAPRLVSMPLSDMIELIGDAKDSRRTWLTDFVEDEVRISEDLYEVLTAYRRLPKGA